MTKKKSISPETAQKAMKAKTAIFFILTGVCNPLTAAPKCNSHAASPLITEPTHQGGVVTRGPEKVQSEKIKL